NLKVLSIQTVAIRAKNQRILLVPNRYPIGGRLEIEEAVTYHAAMQQWLDALSDYLPKLKLTEQEAANVQKAQDWAGKWTGQNSIGWMAAKLLYVLYASKGQGVCVTIHGVGSAPQDFVNRWQATDLTTERFINPKIQSSNYLWNTT